MSFIVLSVLFYYNIDGKVSSFAEVSQKFQAVSHPPLIRKRKKGIIKKQKPEK